MRQFIVTNPNLSVGKPGDVVTSEQLGMSDEQLNVWVEAGYGIEIAPGDDIAADEPEVVEFDPGRHTVAQVLEHVEDNPGEAETVLANEEAGRNRSGIVDVLRG